LSADGDIAAHPQDHSARLRQRVFQEDGCASTVSQNERTKPARIRPLGRPLITSDVQKPRTSLDKRGTRGFSSAALVADTPHFRRHIAYALKFDLSGLILARSRALAQSAKLCLKRRKKPIDVSKTNPDHPRYTSFSGTTSSWHSGRTPYASLLSSPHFFCCASLLKLKGCFRIHRVHAKPKRSVPPPSGWIWSTQTKMQNHSPF